MHIPDSLIEQIRSETKQPLLPKAACRRIASLIISHIAVEATNASSFRVSGLGTFRLRQLAARTVRSPLVPTGTLDVPAKWTLKFRCDAKLEESLNSMEVSHE